MKKTKLRKAKNNKPQPEKQVNSELRMIINCAHDAIVSISDLKPHPKNRNEHPEKQIKLLAKIMKTQGVRNPIVVSNLSGHMTKGHGRLEAAILNGWTEFPVDYQDYESEEMEYADMVADNKIAELAEINLSKVLNDVLDFGPEFDFDFLGIPDFKLPEDFVPQCDEDEIPEVKDTICKPGDLWILGNHRLLCGDSTNIQHVERLMNGEKADMVFTDPPYGMSLDTDYRKMGSKNNFKQIVGDNDDFKPELIQTLLGIFSYCSEIFLFGADYYSELISGIKAGSWIVWDKRSHGEDNIGTLDGAFGSDFELCWSKSRHQRKICRVIRNNGAFIKKREGAAAVHPSQKPVEVASWFFDNWGKDKIIIVDLFGGSGSTIIACEKTSRKCFMMEIDPHYCDVIVARWEKFTGKKAVLSNDP